MARRTLVYKKPVEVIEGAAPAPLRAVAPSVAIAAVTCLLLGSKALFDWTNDLPVGPISDTLLDAAGRWQDAMKSIGLTQFAEAAHALLEAVRGLR
jgi:hypothetical protein